MTDRITVITTVLNDESNIERTIASVLSQDYPALEYVIVDGASKDKTLEVIDRYKERISQVISEPDINCYDGMNKGTKLASGGWLLFLQSGDTFYSNDILTKIMSNAQPGEADIIYGDYVADYGTKGKREIKVRNNLPFWRRHINHQSVLTRRELALEMPFDLSYYPSSDYNFLVHCHVLGKRYLYLDVPVSVRSGGGYSDKNRIAAIIKNHKTVKTYYNGIYIDVYFGSLIILNLSKRIVKFLIPASLQKQIRRNIKP